MKILIAYAIILLGVYTQQQPANKTVEVKLINAKETYSPKDVITFEVTNNSGNKIFIKAGEQVWRKKWENGLEDIVTDPRHKEEILFTIAPHKKRRISAFDISKVIADEQNWARKVLLSSKDSVSLHHADSLLNHKPVIYKRRIMIRFGTDIKKLSSSAYSQAFTLVIR